MFAPVNLASIPSPSTAVWHLGPVPIRAYALCIVAGIVVACIVTDRRMRSRGAPPWAVLDIAVWAVPFGIIGARIYHVVSSPDAYFGTNGHFADAFKIWEGGLGIWGGVAGGALGAWLACKQLGMPLTFVADCMAVGLPLAQAVGRLGNWFNNELYGGRADDLPWGLQIHEMSDGRAGNPPVGQALVVNGEPVLKSGLYHPTFLYELVWNIGVAGLVFWIDRKFKLGKGRAFALYVMAYCIGRAWIEAMRTDTAKIILGQRLNVWVSIVVFLGALAYFLLRKGPQEFLLPAADGAKGFQVVTEAEFQAGAAAQPVAGADNADDDADDPDDDADDPEESEADDGARADVADEAHDANEAESPAKEAKD